MSTYKVKLLARKDTEDNWNSENPTLLNGEFGIATHIVNLVTELKGIKIGENLPWDETPYLPMGNAYGSADAISDVMNSFADTPSINFFYDGVDGKYKFEVIPDGHSHITNVTYIELVDKITNNALIPSNYYRIIDYFTKHRIFGTSIFNDGPNEPLVIQALTFNTLSPFATSIIYPTDTIKYDITNNKCEDNTTPRNGFITYRKDNILNNEVDGYDFRTVKFKRGRAVAPLWSAVKTYIVGAIVKYDIAGVMQYYILTKDNTPAGTVPLAAPTINDVWELLFKESDNFYIAEYFTFSRDNSYANADGLSASGTDLKYFYTFNALGHDSSNGNYSEFKGYNNRIANKINNDGLIFISTNNGASVNNNISTNIGNQSTFYGNKIQNNIFDYLALGVSFPGSEVFNNFINYYNSIFKGIFARNKLLGSYLTYFGNNVTDCNFGTYTNQNIIKGNFQGNIINIGSCIIGSNFQNNNIKGLANSFIENSCQNNASTFELTIGSPTVPIKINYIQFNQPVTGLTTNASVTLNRMIFNTTINNKKILANQSDVTVHSAADGALWALTVQSSTGSLTTTLIS